MPAYPRRTVLSILAVAVLIGVSSLTLYGLPAPSPALALFTWSDADAAGRPCDAFAESFFCGDGEDNDCDRKPDCADVDCAWDTSCGGCPWWDFDCSLPTVAVDPSSLSIWDRPAHLINRLYGEGAVSAIRNFSGAF